MNLNPILVFSGGITPMPIGSQMWANKLAAQWCELGFSLKQNHNAAMTAAIQKQMQAIADQLASFGYVITNSNKKCFATKKVVTNSFVNGQRIGNDCWNSHTGLWGGCGSIAKPSTANRKLGL